MNMDIYDIDVEPFDFEQIQNLVAFKEMNPRPKLEFRNYWPKSYLFILHHDNIPLGCMSLSDADYYKSNYAVDGVINCSIDVLDYVCYDNDLKLTITIKIKK